MVTWSDTCQQLWPQPLLQDGLDWQEDLLSSILWQTGSFYRYFHQSLSFRISDDNHDEVCWAEILSVIPGQAGDLKEKLSAAWAQIRTKDVIQECHPVDLNNKEVNPPEIIINGRSVHRSVLVLLSWLVDCDGDTPRPCLHNVSRLWQLFCS